ncbi:MAG: PqqD family protein, partial [Erysipelotrichaceae bacterium]|nr:PqqD family protein [Erysipelotrichaceae bacterium]
MKKNKEFIMRQIADEYILVPTGNTTEDFNGIISMSQTGAYIYEHIEECSSFDELVKKMLDLYDVDEEILVSDINEFLNKMLQLEIIKF